MTLQERLSRLNQKLLENDPSRRSFVASQQLSSLQPQAMQNSLQPADLSLSQQNLASQLYQAEGIDEVMRQATEALSQKEMANIQLRKELEQIQQQYTAFSREEGAKVEALRQKLDAQRIYFQELDGEKQQEYADYEQQIAQLNERIAVLKTEIVAMQGEVVEPEIVQFVQSLKDRLV